MLMLTMIISLLAIVIAYFANTLGYQSTADIALRSALRSGGIAAAAYALPEGDPSDGGVDDGYARWFIDPAVGATAPLGVPLSPWSAGTGGVARRVTLLVLQGEAGRSGSFADRFGGTLSSVLGSDTNNLLRDGLDVEVLNPAADANQIGCSSLNDSSCSPAPICTAAGLFPEGITSALDGNCYTTSTVVLRVRISVVQTAGTVMLIRTVAVGAGSSAELVP
jgi:hypothetical protein